MFSRKSILDAQGLTGQPSPRESVYWGSLSSALPVLANLPLYKRALSSTDYCQRSQFGSDHSALLTFNHIPQKPDDACENFPAMFEMRDAVTHNNRRYNI
jgi:hypothetical protein